MPTVLLVIAAIKSFCDFAVTEQGQRLVKDTLDGGTAIEGAIAKVVDAAKTHFPHFGPIGAPAK